MRRRSLVAAAITSGLTAALLSTSAPAALACGCFNPPVPESIEGYAINQQAEQILFEVVDDTTVTAHVLIKYAGDPAQFGWLIPVPSLPDLDLSENVAFGLIDERTAPDVRVTTRHRCPDYEYACHYHPYEPCGDEWVAQSSAGGFAGDGGWDTSSGDAASAGGYAPPVTVLASEQIGAYDTIVFEAEDASLTVGWLQDNGFIVNDSTTPYMQPYLDAGMLFVAAKLIPGAGTDEIKPLKMTYEHMGPIIPLVLTAVAAEPHLAVTSYIFADEAYVPAAKALVPIDATRITEDDSGRNNYPMVLSRTIDEAGGDAFVAEYAGTSKLAWAGEDDTGCCSEGDDWCGVGWDDQCQCPGAEWDADACSEIEGLLESIDLLDGLSDTYSHLTRLTTRVSPEEMDFDPVFAPASAGDDLPIGRLILDGERTSLQGCVGDVLDTELYEDIVSRQACATVYCGPGACVLTDVGPGCVCDTGFVAREFTDLDGATSVTCVPSVGTVDWGLEIDLPSACTGVTIAGDTSCLDVGGFPTAVCGEGSAGVLIDSSSVPSCQPIVWDSGGSGARDYSRDLDDVPVCAPRPPDCGSSGWLEPVDPDDIQIQGESCEANQPDASEFVIPDKDTCGPFGCHGAAPPRRRGVDTTSWWVAAALLLLAGLAAWRRRREV